MAGNLRADNNGDILVEFDYNNIIVVDPNKTINSEGKIQERLVDHESLVMYVNLEADVLPRTKLAVGASPEDRIKTISVAKMNFLKPTKESFLGVGYYDELTGENTTNFKGDNQTQQKIASPNNGNQAYTFETPADLSGILDNGLLGITTINITTNSSFIPSVNIRLEDVQGKALFQLGDSSPYSAFFNLPYPPFYLTLKGYYGQAIRYQLNLEKFHASFNTFSGNYQIDLDFKGYKFNVLNEVSMGHLLAVPHMYGQTFDISTTPGGTQESNSAAQTQSNVEGKVSQNNAQSQDAVVTQIVSEKGYQKIVEVFSEYKSKGLIPADLPELTLFQLMSKLQTFENTIMASFPPAKVAPLTNVRNYKEVLKQYFSAVRNGGSSWFSTYLNPKPIILTSKQQVYIFKENLDKGAQTSAISLLQSYVTKFNKALSENKTLGSTGETPIPNPIKYDMISFEKPSDGNIDWDETTRIQTGKSVPNEEDIESIKKLILQIKKPVFGTNQVNGQTTIEEIEPKFFIFEGNDRFDKQLSLLETQSNKKLTDYEASISAELLRKIEDTATGLGFRPTVRNLIAVVMASTEAFLRLLDDVHTNAWNVKYDPVRKNAILDNPSSAPSSDTKQNVVISKSAQESNQGLSNSQEPVYPWPQFFVESNDDKKPRFELKYIADPTVVDLTQGWNYAKWPEVQFVEEYMKGITQKYSIPSAPPPLDSERDTDRININAIEFPSAGLSYVNKEEVKFFYEIWERQFLTSHYSGLIRANQNQIDSLITLNSEAEINNIFQSVNINAPYLSLKLKNYNLTASGYPEFLKTISNSGTGRAYQDYIRDFFVTPYIRNLVENSYSILSISDIGKIPQVSTKSAALEQLLSNASNEPLVVDTLPYTDPSWSLNNLSSSNKSIGNEVYNTKRTLKVFEPRKLIANFTDVYNFNVNRPVTNFSFYDTLNPSISVATAGVFGGNPLTNFYIARQPSNFIATEGYCEYTSPTNLLPIRTTTSMLNTPYFINSIQNGVQNSRTSDPYPYVQSAYLFLNSLPLASLRERYKTKTDTFVDELDYIASCFKKFGAIHKIPYAWILKYGSIWHRYKKYTESNVDILSSAWKNFDYTTNFSPILSSNTQTYDIKIDNVNTPITLQTEDAINISMQVGFYPKVINDFNVFYNGYELYSEYTSSEVQQSINGGLKLFNFDGSNINSVVQGSKVLNLKTWSALLQDKDYSNDISCDPTNNTKGIEYFVVPSFGSTFNQTQTACIEQTDAIPTTKVNLTSNSSVYNGSVRTLWSAPNYGYFDNSQIKYPNPDSYLNFINNGEIQSPLYFLNEDKYSKIEEVFSVFEKKILDTFESEFLNFCKPITDMSSENVVVGIGESTVNPDSVFRNFQSLFKSLMTIPAQNKNESNTEYFNNSINNQYSVFQGGIKSFMNYDVLFRYGNPSNYKRRNFDSYLSHNSAPTITDPIVFQPYVANTLPSSSSSLTLSQSKLLNPNAWKTLETEVGFSTIDNVEYSSTGSYITDFFIDNNIQFTVDNIVLLSPIIKMYATQKLRNPSITTAQFKNLLTQYLDSESILQDNFLNRVLSGVRLRLPNQQQLPERTIQSAFEGQQSKVENYEVFKALNDKWVSGGDFKSKTLFEDMLFLDRASRNIGDTLLLDIFDLKNMFNTNSLNQVMSVYTFISGILIKNNFTVMNLPAYVNFYNVQDVDGTTIPNRTEGSLELANSLWGTFLDVDYRNSSSKMVCFYAGKPSEHLALPEGSSRYRNDGFEMRRSSENPLIENQSGKKDWGVSNKCVGFNVDIGTRNQGVFYSFSVSQDNGKATSESINTQIDIVNQASGKNVATQNVGLYNLYKKRSYGCSVISLGNALLQPMMYFNLKHVPMFNGPYLIQQVEHSIQPGQFQTTFTGVRQGIYDLPAIDSYLQSINQNLLSKVEELLKIKKDTINVLGNTTDEVNAAKIPQKSDTTKAAENTCESKVLPVYSGGFGFVSTGATQTNITEKVFAERLNALIPNLPILQTIIYCISYIESFQKYNNNKSGKFNGWDNNFASISLNYDWGALSASFVKKYSCVNVKTTPSTSNSLPLVNFTTLDSYILFMRDRLIQRISQISEIGLLKYYVSYWSQPNVSPGYYDTHTEDFNTLSVTINNSLNSALSVKVATKEIVDDLKNTISKVKSEGKSKPNATPTPTQVTPLPGQTCPPPVIRSFSPLSGNTGTIVQLNGVNFNDVTSIKVGNVEVPSTGITIFNDTTLRFNTPQIGTGQVVSNDNIVITSSFGSGTSVDKYTFDPSIVASEAASPGGYQNPEKQTTNAAPGNNENTNPQDTGVLTMIGTAIQLNESKTQSLNVKINPQSTGYVLSSTPEMKYVVYELEEVNGKVTRKYISQSVIGVDGQVANNEFNVTLNEVESYLINNIPKIEGKTQIDIVFIFKAFKGQTEPVVQQFPFKVWYTLPNQSQVPVDNIPTNQTLPTFPPQKIAFINLGESPNLQGNGGSYYNIKKPAGGYITLQLTTEKPFADRNVESIKVLNATTYDIVSYSGSGGSPTNYTNEITVSGLGSFRLQVLYRPYGFTSPINGEVLTQTIISDVFTL
jgi:hypothetical protein